MARRRTFEKYQKHEIRKALRKCKDTKALRRLQVLDMRSRGKSNQEITEAIGFSEQYVTVLVTKYFGYGLEAIQSDKRTSNNRRLSHEAEERFLEQFRELAEEGPLITIEGILLAFEKETGKPSGASTIYDLLKRHGWCKVKPRPRHPGSASEEEINSSKKLKLSWAKS
jgi:transposase